MLLLLYFANGYWIPKPVWGLSCFFLFSLFLHWGLFSYFGYFVVLFNFEVNLVLQTVFAFFFGFSGFLLCLFSRFVLLHPCISTGSLILAISLLDNTISFWSSFRVTVWAVSAVVISYLFLKSPEKVWRSLYHNHCDRITRNMHGTCGWQKIKRTDTC